MFALTPFERKSYDLFNAFHDFENDFFTGTALKGFKTDLRDEGDKYGSCRDLKNRTSALTSQATR